MEKVDDLEQAIERSKNLIKSLEERGYKADGERQLLSWLEELQNFRVKVLMTKEEILDYVCNKEENTEKAQGMLNALKIVEKHMESKGV